MRLIDADKVVEQFSKEYYIFRKKTSGSAGCLFVYSKITTEQRKVR